MEKFLKYLSGIPLGIWAAIQPTVPFAGVLLFAILLDCWSASDLSRRLKKIYPENVEGKFQSRYALKILKTLLQAYSVVVLLHLVDDVILYNFGYLNMSNIAAAVFCGVQLWSILENLSSANGAKWAKVLQRIMVDKSKRHFQIHIANDIWAVMDEKTPNVPTVPNVPCVLLLIMLLTSSCCTSKQAIAEKETVTVTEILRDTTVIIQPDASMTQALLECDENRNIVIRQLTELQSGLHLQPPRLELRNNVLTATAQVDSFAIYITWKEREKRVENVRTVTETTNRLTGWQWFQVWLGRIAMLILTVSIITRILIIFKK
jgi:hypothetical protein